MNHPEKAANDGDGDGGGESNDFLQLLKKIA
jgi:hypothetical protein